jgi:hypothetical protein
MLGDGQAPKLHRRFANALLHGAAELPAAETPAQETACQVWAKYISYLFIPHRGVPLLRRFADVVREISSWRAGTYIQRCRWTLVLRLTYGMSAHPAARRVVELHRREFADVLPPELLRQAGWTASGIQRVAGPGGGGAAAGAGAAGGAGEEAGGTAAARLTAFAIRNAAQSGSPANAVHELAAAAWLAALSTKLHDIFAAQPNPRRAHAQPPALAEWVRDYNEEWVTRTIGEIQQPLVASNTDEDDTDDDNDTEASLAFASSAGPVSLCRPPMPLAVDVATELRTRRASLVFDVGLNVQQRAVAEWYADQLAAGNQVLLLLHGCGGTGKTWTMAEIARIERHFGGKFKNTASTGVAATLLHLGSTGHHAFGVPVFANGRGGRSSGRAEPLSATAIANVQQRFGVKTTAVCLDEISFSTAEFVSHVHFNLSQAFPTPDVHGQQRPFGGKNMVFCGDFFQQSPPSGNSIPFSLMMLTARAHGHAPPMTAASEASDIGAELFARFHRVDVTIQMRSQDPVHTALLERLRDPGNYPTPLTAADIMSWNRYSADLLLRDALFREATVVTSTNEEVCAFEEVLVLDLARRLGQVVFAWWNPMIVAGAAEEAPCDMSQLFYRTTRLKRLRQYFVVGGPAYITSNLSTEKCIANGTPGVMQSLAGPLTSPDGSSILQRDWSALEPGTIVEICQPLAINVLVGTLLVPCKTARKKKLLGSRGNQLAVAWVEMVAVLGLPARFTKSRAKRKRALCSTLALEPDRLALNLVDTAL